VSLQTLNLGSNKISELNPNLSKNQLLTELLLNSNQIEQISITISFPILKTLKLNVNHLSSFKLGFCPLLENLNLNDN